MSRCETIQERIQDRMDGPVPAEVAQEIELHLTTCRECREFQGGLLRVRAELQALPEVPFPDDALEDVWRKTVANRVAPQRRAGAWWLAAAAAIFVVAVLVRLAGPADPAPTRAEMARAERDTRIALGAVARALRTTERTTVHRVLAHEVSPVLRRIPVRWPKAADPDPARSRT